MLNLSTRAQCESGYQAYSDDVMFSEVFCSHSVFVALFTGFPLCLS